MTTGRILAALALVLATARLAPGSSQPFLVRDINAEAVPSASGMPSALRPAAGGVYFTAVADFRTSLWRTDGSEEGTQRLERVQVFESVAVGASLFYAGETLERSGLWLSDGSPGNARLLLSTARSAVAPLPNRLTAFGSILLFAHGDAEHGRELWRSDGTAAGTERVTDLAPGAASALNAFDDAALAVVGQQAFFFANETNAAFELWATDGTAGGTRLVRRFLAPANPSGEFRARHLTAAAGRVWFALSNGQSEVEVWVSDGSDAGTHDLGEVRLGGFGGTGEGLVTAVGDLVYFAGSRPGEGAELWVSDGTAEGTALVADLDPGPEGSAPRNLVAAGNTLYFLANQTPESGARVFGQLWRADGAVLTVLRPSGGVSSVVRAEGDVLYLAAEEQSCPGICPDFSRLWRSDGTPAGTVPVENSPLRPHDLTPLGAAVLFAGTEDATGTELWRSDGTAEGTFLLADLFAPTESSSPAALTAAGERVFFRANGGGGIDLWSSDGTPEGTVELTAFDLSTLASPPANLTPLGDVVLFGTNTDEDRGLWSSDGTTPGTRRLASLPEGVTLSSAGAGVAYFTAGLEAPALWRSDGSPDGTAAIVGDLGAFVSKLVAAGSRAYLELSGAQGAEVWTSDGSEGGTRRVAGITGAVPRAPVERFDRFGDRVVFQLGSCNPFGGVPTQPLWLADGEAARLLSEETCVGAEMADLGDRLLFISSGAAGGELWSTDGTAAGTRLVVDLAGRAASGARRVGDHALFLTYDARLNGRLWRSDGTAAGTAVVAEIERGQGLVEFRFAAANATRAYLLVSRRSLFPNDIVLQEVWSSDGTAAGTEHLFTLLPDLGTAFEFFNTSPLAATASLLFLALREESIGEELWAAALNEAVTCPIDCDDDGRATTAELTAGLRMALGEAGAACASVGRLRRVTVDQLVAGVACR